MPRDGDNAGAVRKPGGGGDAKRVVMRLAAHSFASPDRAEAGSLGFAQWHTPSGLLARMAGRPQIALFREASARASERHAPARASTTTLARARARRFPGHFVSSRGACEIDRASRAPTPPAHARTRRCRVARSRIDHAVGCTDLFAALESRRRDASCHAAASRRHQQQ
jgi:hypothetical protein